MVIQDFRRTVWTKIRHYFYRKIMCDELGRQWRNCVVIDSTLTSLLTEELLIRGRDDWLLLLFMLKAILSSAACMRHVAILQLASSLAYISTVYDAACQVSIQQQCITRHSWFTYLLLICYSTCYYCIYIKWNEITVMGRWDVIQRQEVIIFTVIRYRGLK